MVACASTSRSSLAVSCGSTSWRNRSTPSRLDGSTDAWPSRDRAALIAEQHEMPVGQPAQQRGDVLAVGAGEPALGVGVEFGGQADAASRPSRASRAPPGGRRRARWAAAARPRPPPWGRPIRTAATWIHVSSMPSRNGRRRTAGSMSSSSPAVPAPHPEHRVHDGLVGDPEPVQQHGDGVHQHRRVVGDDLQRGAEPAGVVVGVDRDEGLARACRCLPSR